MSNPFFIGRQAELAYFTRLLDDAGASNDAPLVILNVHGHSGVGKTWLLGAFRDTCRDKALPFAQLDAYRLGEELSPTALLTNLADQLALDVDGVAGDMLTFDRLLPRFITALVELPHPIVALVVDDYDQLFHVVDPWLRNLFRAVQGVDQFTGPPSHRPAVPPQALPRIVTVINSHEPVRERWPPNPLYSRVLETLPLVDFSFAETCDYLTVRGIDDAHHWQLFRLTQGHPLTLALAVSLYEDLDGAGDLDKACNHPPILPEASDDVMQHVLTWALRDMDDEVEDTQLHVTEMLRAAAEQSVAGLGSVQRCTPRGIGQRARLVQAVGEKPLDRRIRAGCAGGRELGARGGADPGAASNSGDNALAGGVRST